MTCGKSPPLKSVALLLVARGRILSPGSGSAWFGLTRGSATARPSWRVSWSGALGLLVAAFMVLNVVPAAARGGGGHGGGGSGGHESDAGGCSGGCGGEDEGGGGHSGSGKKGPHGGAYIGRGSSGQSLRDVFRQLESGTHGTEEDHASSSKHSSPKH